MLHGGELQPKLQPCAPSGTLPVAGTEHAMPVSAVSTVSNHHLDLCRPAARIICDWRLHVISIASASGLHIAMPRCRHGRSASKRRTRTPTQEGVKMAGLVRMSLDSPEETRPFEADTGQLELVNMKEGGVG